MKRLLLAFAMVSASAIAQPGTGTIRASAPNTMNQMRRHVVNGRYELRDASVVDLICAAWNVQPDNVLGGPDWLDDKRFDLSFPVEKTANASQLSDALRKFLAQQFHLVTHGGTRDVPVFALTIADRNAVEKSFHRSADDAAPSDCTPQPAGLTEPITLQCRNFSLAKFADLLPRRRASGYLFTYRVIDRTGLEGDWDFDARWTPRDSWRPIAPPGETITVFDAIQRLGLKLALTHISEAAIVVDKIEQPSLDAADRLPSLQFEVAEIKPTVNPPECSNVGIQPGGRVHVVMTLQGMIQEAWGDMNPRRIVGARKGIADTCYDMLAKAATEPGFAAGWNGPVWNGLDLDSMRQMLRAFLVDRFKLQAHMDTRVIPGYVLEAARPRLRAADPSRRSGCGSWLPDNRRDPRLANPAASTLLTCHNVTMKRFAQELYRVFHDAPPIVDETKLTGHYDFSVHFTPPGAFEQLSRPGGGDAAAEPTGALSIFEALSSQLGLKLQPRNMPGSVLVIDSVNLTPTDN